MSTIPPVRLLGTPSTTAATTHAPAEAAPSVQHDSTPVSASQTLDALAQQAGVNKATAMPLRFSGVVDTRQATSVRLTTKVTPNVISSVHRSLMLQDMAKEERGDSSNLQLNLDMYGAGYGDALANVMHMVPRPVDTFISYHMGAVGLNTLLSSTGNRLMSATADLNVGPFENGVSGRNHETEIRQEFINDYVRKLEHLLVERAGTEPSRPGMSAREQAYEDLNSAKTYNGLEALYYGTKGLVDGVVVGKDRVVTRDDLTQYLGSRKNLKTEEDIKRFLSRKTNIRNVPSRPLKDVFPETIQTAKDGSSAPSWNQSIRDKFAQQQAEQKLDAEMQQKSQYITAKEASEAPLSEDDQKVKAEVEAYLEKKQVSGTAEKIQLFTTGPDGQPATAALEILPARREMDHDQITPGRLEIANVPDPKNFFNDSAIFFDDAFTFDIGRQMTEALLSEDEKKSGEKNPSNIKLVVNSPGGYAWSWEEMKGVIERLDHKVDMAVNGYAASCGAMLICSVTGNRFATPGAYVMTHESSGGSFAENTKNMNEQQDYSQSLNHVIADVIATRSGRPMKDVAEDLKYDLFFNPLESMVYGTKGLIDGVIVQTPEGEKVVTREDFRKYLDKHYGSAKKADKAIKERLQHVRKGNTQWRPEQHDENNPFDNQLRVLNELAQTAKPMREIPQFADSMPRVENGMDWHVLKDKKGEL